MRSLRRLAVPFHAAIAVAAIAVAAALPTDVAGQLPQIRIVDDASGQRRQVNGQDLTAAERVVHSEVRHTTRVHRLRCELNPGERQVRVDLHVGTSDLNVGHVRQAQHFQIPLTRGRDKGKRDCGEPQ